MLDWLEQKEKEVETIGNVDISNEKKLDMDLEKLKVIFYFTSSIYIFVSRIAMMIDCGGDDDDNYGAG